MRLEGGASMHLPVWLLLAIFPLVLTGIALLH